MTTIDVYAMTNPAVCSLVLWSFLKGYVSKDENGCQLPLMFLPIPIILSSTTATKLNHTNSQTGFIPWVMRNPEVAVNMYEKVQHCVPFTRSAITFGIRYGLFNLNESSQFDAPLIRLSSRQAIDENTDLKDILEKAKRLGVWIGQAKSPTIIFHTLGITI
jgi:hypothetical protein